MNSECFSVQRPSRNRELRMVQKIFKLSLRDACLGKPRSTNKRSFNTSNVSSRCKGDNGKGMKGGHQEGTKNQEVREVHYVALIDVRRIQKYEYIRVNSRKSNLKCGNYQPRWKSCTRTSREDRWSRNEGRKFKLGQSSTKWLTVVINEKLREWIQNHPPVQVPSLNNSECLILILTSPELWITVHHCAKKKNTSIIGVANLDSLSWNITSMAHKIRTTLKRRWIFKRASGKPLPSRCG